MGQEVRSFLLRSIAAGKEEQQCLVDNTKAVSFDSGHLSCVCQAVLMFVFMVFWESKTDSTSFQIILVRQKICTELHEAFECPLLWLSKVHISMLKM